MENICENLDQGNIVNLSVHYVGTLLHHFIGSFATVLSCSRVKGQRSALTKAMISGLRCVNEGHEFLKKT